MEKNFGKVDGDKYCWTFRCFNYESPVIGYFPEDSNEADLECFTDDHDGKQFLFGLRSCPKGMAIDLVMHFKIFDPDGKIRADHSYKMENMRGSRAKLTSCSPSVADGNWTKEVTISCVKRTVDKGKPLVSFRIPTATESKEARDPNPPDISSTSDAAKSTIDLQTGPVSKKIRLEADSTEGDNPTTSRLSHSALKDAGGKTASSATQNCSSLAATTSTAKTPRDNIPVISPSVNLTDKNAGKSKSIVEPKRIQRENATSNLTETLVKAKGPQLNAKPTQTGPVPILPTNRQPTPAATNDQFQVRKYPDWPAKLAKYADFHIQTSDGYEFAIHKVKLADKSVDFTALFDRMDRRGVNRAVIKDIRGDEMFEILMFVYAGKPTENFENVIDQVYHAAHTYKLVELKKFCEEKLIEQMSFGSVCNSIKMAKMYGGDQLLAESLEFVKDNREDPQLHWDHLAEFCDGEFLKKFAYVLATKKSLKRKRKY